MLPVACRTRYWSLVKPPSRMKMSANEGSPILDWSLNTAILRTASSSLPSLSTSSETLILSMVRPMAYGGSRGEFMSSF